jgi:hypothetical protein
MRTMGFRRLDPRMFNLYDANHRLEATIDTPIDRTNSSNWNSSGDLATFTDERNMRRGSGGTFSLLAQRGGNEMRGLF